MFHLNINRRERWFRGLAGGAIVIVTALGLIPPERALAAYIIGVFVALQGVVGF